MNHVLLLYKITELAGYTSRVAEMFQVFSDVKEGKFQRSMVVEQPQKQHQKIEGPLEMRGLSTSSIILVE